MLDLDLRKLAKSCAFAGTNALHHPFTACCAVASNTFWSVVTRWWTSKQHVLATLQPAFVCPTMPPATPLV